MTERYSISDIQESYDYVYEYRYCDKCGSFDLGFFSKFPDAIDKVLVVIVLASVPTALIVLFYDTSFWYISCLIGFVGLISFVLIGATGDLQCNQCGNTDISSRNVLNYSSGDRSVIDVPDRSIRKDHIETIQVD